MVSTNLNEVAHAIGRSGDADRTDWFTGDVNDRRADSGDVVVPIDCCPSGASGVFDFVAHVVKVDDEVVEVGVGDEMVDKLVGLVCGHRGEDGAAHRGDMQWKALAVGGCQPHGPIWFKLININDLSTFTDRQVHRLFGGVS